MQPLCSFEKITLREKLLTECYYDRKYVRWISLLRFACISRLSLSRLRRKRISRRFWLTTRICDTATIPVIPPHMRINALPRVVTHMEGKAKKKQINIPDNSAKLVKEPKAPILAGNNPFFTSIPPGRSSKRFLYLYMPLTANS